MCTAVSFKTRDHYFGRTLDLEYHYNEQVVITPRAYLLPFRKIGQMRRHYALIGMATVADGYPLYYDATNEKGLSMAGLNFPGNAFYHGETVGKENIAVNSFHHQAVKDVAPGFKATAKSKDGCIEAIEMVKNPKVWGVQFHPEHLVNGDNAENFIGIFKALLQ